MKEKKGSPFKPLLQVSRVIHFSPTRNRCPQQIPIGTPRNGLRHYSDCVDKDGFWKFFLENGNDCSFGSINWERMIFERERVIE